MSAFGYFGSKLRIAAKLCNELPPHNAWVELFCGSAAMTLAKKPAKIEIINDINEEIVNFYKQLRENGPRLRKLIKLTPYAKAELELARAENGEDIPELERARRFFVSAMMALNGSFGKNPGGFSVSHSYARNGVEARVNRWNAMPEYLRGVTSRLANIRIERTDALRLLDDYKDRPATLMYLDPPYLGERILGYDHDENEKEFHEKLLKKVVKAKCMVFISGYDNSLYRKYLNRKNGWNRKFIRALTKGHNGKAFERKEVIWFNAAYRKAKRLKRVPIRLSKEEKKNGKINPSRGQLRTPD
ncbi:MAG TPA: DNA adenine methylase [Candidatus Angelobacter sp.]|nr:DNA adenine methylase [Candidatus Angelobacter sp.]